MTHLVEDLPINFPNQVMPLFTKYSCNGGGCHGKSGGQNGFRLSLLGFEPKEDYEYLVKEGPRPPALSRRARSEPAAAEGDRPPAARRRPADRARFAGLSPAAALDRARHAVWQGQPIRK